MLYYPSDPEEAVGPFCRCGHAHEESPSFDLRGYLHPPMFRPGWGCDSLCDRPGRQTDIVRQLELPSLHGNGMLTTENGAGRCHTKSGDHGVVDG